MKKYLIVLLLSISCLAYSVQFSSMYSDHKSFSIGDVITIIIEENSSAQTSADNSTDKSFNHSVNIDKGVGPLSFIPLSGMGMKAANKAKGAASTSRSNKLNTKMTAKIDSIDVRGNLVIKGSRAVIVNGEKEITELKGVVRPQDVSSDNSVYSYNIADAQISYKGKGAIKDGSKIGILSRIVNFLF